MRVQVQSCDSPKLCSAWCRIRTTSLRSTVCTSHCLRSHETWRLATGGMSFITTRHSSLCVSSCNLQGMQARLRRPARHAHSDVKTAEHEATAISLQQSCGVSDSVTWGQIMMAHKWQPILPEEGNSGFKSSSSRFQTPTGNTAALTAAPWSLGPLLAVSPQSTSLISRAGGKRMRSRQQQGECLCWVPS